MWRWQPVSQIINKSDFFFFSLLVLCNLQKVSLELLLRSARLKSFTSYKSSSGSNKIKALAICLEASLWFQWLTDSPSTLLARIISPPFTDKTHFLVLFFSLNVSLHVYLHHVGFISGAERKAIAHVRKPKTQNNSHSLHGKENDQLALSEMWNICTEIRMTCWNK